MPRKSKTHFHVFARNRRPAGDYGWFHEISLDTREDADVEKDNLKFHGYRVKIVRSADDPAAMVRAMNAELRASGEIVQTLAGC